MALSMSDDLLGAILPVVVYWVYSGFYAVLGNMKSMEGRRLHPREDEDVRNIPSRREVVYSVLTHQAFQTALFLIAFMVTGGVGQTNGTDQYSSSPLAIAIQIFIAMVVLDTWEYWLHRFYHTVPFFYKHFHSKHHKLLVPYAYGALYGHPLEGIITETIGGSLAFLISGMSPRTAIFFFCFTTMKTVDDHCGLWLPWNPMQTLFKNNCAFHDVHHQLYGNKYNFATPFFVSWDKILGTYLPYAVVKRKGGGFEARPVKD